jgi:2-keto-3-deoxy-L-rhamnonate aldolase RhmA
MGHTGLDSVVLDLEHGPNTVLSFQNLIRTTTVADALPDRQGVDMILFGPKSRTMNRRRETVQSWGDSQG